jgi:uncharacterized protein (UPF0276 family)
LLGGRTEAMIMQPFATLADMASRAGIGLRAPHVARITAERPAVGFLEVHAENYMCGGPAIRRLERLRRDYAISVHGVGLSLGSAHGLDIVHLERLADLVARMEPAMVSEHLTWSVAEGAFLNDLVPVPFTAEALDVLCANIDATQHRLGRSILIENPSVYARFAHADIEEHALLAEVVARTGCGVLCDVNNIFVSTHNVGGDPIQWLESLPAHAVAEIHLAGHCVNEAEGTHILIDDHGSPVCEAVWALYRHAVRRFPHAASLVEWDSNIPALPVLLEEAAKADAVRAQTLGGRAAHASDAA